MPSQQLQHWFATLTSNSPFFFAILDKKHNYRMVSDRYCDIAGLGHDEIVGLNDSQVLGEQFYKKLAPYYQRAFKGDHVEAEITLDETDLETSLHFSLSPVHEENEIRFVVFHAIDTSEKQILVRSLEESESKFAKLTQLLPDGLLLVEDDIIISANPASARLLGLNSPHELLGEELTRLFIDENSKKVFTHRISTLLSEKPFVCLTSARCGFERKVQLHADTTAILGSESQIILIQDADDAPKLLSSNSNEDAHIDSLTKLYNRFGFTKRLEQLIKNQTPLLVFYLDIDNFKNINDSLGHHIGDKVIQEVSSRLKRSLPNQAIIGHLGGDEFGIILPEPENTRMAEILSERIISLINQPFDLHHFSKRLACSIGSVRYPEDGQDARILLQNADTAMYEAKDRGRNRLIKFNDQMNKEARMRLWLEIELQKALQQNGLEVWYQPKVNARDFSINGAEALVRWKHPVEGYISDSEHTLQMLNAIKKLGFALSIDDFGTGYSSLSYLARFPIDELKIDRAFINDIDTLPKQVTVIENIINLGKSLDLTVVAEGVETHQQATLLSNLQCNSIQGFHFYRPQPKHEVEELFAQNRRHKN
ncbi:EAL domain-containing protein [Vibrio owensii]|uniref:sensor domain-containing protein n=1 Tax=Vibrio owensii TaxID=696485 RepID=UPI002F402974